MTTVIKQMETDGYYIYIAQDKFSPVYRVGIAQKHGEHLYGYPMKEGFYDSLNSAKRRFYDLKRRYANEYNMDR